MTDDRESISWGKYDKIFFTVSKIPTIMKQTTLAFLPVQIFLEYILEGMMEVEGELPVRCRGRPVGWCSWLFLCCSCTLKCS